MTREEAIDVLQEKHDECKAFYDLAAHPEEAYPGAKEYMEALQMALAALRGPTREQVILCKDCQYWQGNNGGYPHPECRWGNDETPDEDDYCSFAERLEVSKNG